MENGFRQLTEQDLNTVSTAKQTQYGALGMAGDGRMFKYVGFGGTSTIAPGQLCVAQAYTANYVGLAITATTVATTPAQTTASLTAGSNYLVLTNGSTAITQDQFAEGYLEVNQTSGSNNGPIVYKILGNTAAAASTGYVTVYLAESEPLRNASVLVPGTDTANLYPSPFSAVAPSSTAGQSVGVTPVQVVNTSSVTNYGWVQVTGTVLLTNDAGGNLTVGEGIAQSTTTAGDIVAVGATTFQIGQTQKAFNSSTTGPCNINLL
jgi:hypothetical protein